METNYTIVDTTNHETLADRAVVAADSASRRKGWLGRRSVFAREAIWITPCNAIHCFFMRFPIDALFVDRQLSIVGMRLRLKPWRIAVCWRAHSVMEFPAGLIEEMHVALGDQLMIEKRNINDR